MRYEQRIQRYLILSEIDLSCRRHDQLYPRYYLINFLSKKTKLSLTAIGKIFEKDHTTVIHAINQAEMLEPYQDYQKLTQKEQSFFPMHLPFEFGEDGFSDPTMIVKSLAFLETQIFKSHEIY